MQEAELRKALVETLYASPTSLAFGALAGSVVSITIARYVADPFVSAGAGAICITALLRVIVAIIFLRFKKSQNADGIAVWGFCYEAGAWLYALLIGLQAFAVLMRGPDAVPHMLAVALAAGYSAGISGRNAGQIKVAIGQIFLSLAPTALGLMLVGTPAYITLGIVLALMIPGMAEISATTHRIVMAALVGERENAKLASRYEELAQIDSMTGIENRYAMQRHVERIYEQGVNDMNQLAIIWLDLDRFKQINDSLGHMTGDKLLQQVAGRIRDTVRDRGLVTRFGGDEFVILCPGSHQAAAEMLAGEILEAISEPVKIGGNYLSVTPSIGIAVGPHDGDTAEELMQNADMALFEAKRMGRNRYCLFQWSMKARLKRLHMIEEGLSKAIARGEFEVYYQPVFNLDTGAIIYCEALMRWHHPVLGEVPPNEFVPIAENISVMGPITEWVLDEACVAAVNWPDNIRLAVNISPTVLCDMDLPRKIIATLYTTGLNPGRLGLEMTETVFLQDNHQTQHLLRELQNLGISLILDDFGTGYSSLSYLRSYDFDSVKVDKSFMERIDKSREDRAVVRSVALLAEALEMDTVAEGIETMDQLRYAYEMGFTNVQGYLLSQPMRLADLNRLLTEVDHAELMANMLGAANVTDYAAGSAPLQGAASS